VISALQHSKSSVDRIEDVITASVFDTLLLLPGKRVWQILRASCYGNEKLPEEVGELQFDDRAFWPRWDSEGTDNTNFVAPDVFIPFEELDLVIEAKRDGNSQERGQWERELKAYGHCDAAKNNVFLLAIDGLAGNTKPETVTVPLAGRKKAVTIVKTDWARLLEVLQREQSRQKHEDVNDTEYHILSMAIDWLTHFGYGMTWLNELVKADKENHEPIASLLAIADFESDVKCLQNFCVIPDIANTDDEDSSVWFCNMLDTDLSISNYGKDVQLLKTFGGQDE
jgi:hypothetical protein